MLKVLKGPIAAELCDPNSVAWLIRLSRMTRDERADLAAQYRRQADAVDRYSDQVSWMRQPLNAGHQDSPFRN